ncbi:hypothetical protein [Microbispora sp. NPDC049125]|uniref:hypothetical protein n=1 Tax=Microbispora sp. NPDC049125 TaxID=3154929 RepID=UPI00346713E4
MPGWLHSDPLPHLWLPDRYEVRSLRPGPDGAAVDRYHFTEAAYEAATRLRDAGLATQIQVIRLADGVTLFDLLAGVEAPAEEW